MEARAEESLLYTITSPRGYGLGLGGSVKGLGCSVEGSGCREGSGRVHGGFMEGLGGIS